MSYEARHDIFEPGDLTALVCVEQPEPQQQIIGHLTSMDYKVHTGLFLEDIALKMKTHPYDVIFIDETFGGSTLGQNPVLAEMSSFIFSADLVFSYGDLNNLKPVLRRGVTRQREFYHQFKEGLKIEGMR